MKAKHLRLAVVGLLVALAAVFAVVSYQNSERLDAVTLRFTGPGVEPQDAALLGKEHLKPDYRLDIVHAEGRFRCGTVLNTLAAGGIRFVVTGDIPLRRTQELILVEEDSVNDDLLTRAQFVPPSMSSGGYAFSAESTRSFAVGLAWFFGTGLGKAVAAGITLSIIALVVLTILS